MSLQHAWIKHGTIKKKNIWREGHVEPEMTKKKSQKPKPTPEKLCPANRGDAVEQFG